MIDKLKKMKIQAMRDKDADLKSILSVLHSDAQIIAKNDGNRDLTEDDITNAAKKLINRNNKAIVDIESNNKSADHLKKENEVLSEFLPEMYSEENTYLLIDDLLNNSELDLVKSNMGKFMGSQQLK
jgi:uncharacterized protein YqeY